jgi:hypothetical protein
MDVHLLLLQLLLLLSSSFLSCVKRRFCRLCVHIFTCSGAAVLVFAAAGGAVY